MKNVYLDYSATTPVKEEVLKEMLPYFSDMYGNPSSLYTMGLESKDAITKAREQLAALIEREPAYLSRIEHGNQKPSLDTLLRKYSAAMSDVNMVAVQNMIPSAKRLLTRRNKAAIIQTNNKFCRRRLECKRVPERLCLCAEIRRGGAGSD